MTEENGQVAQPSELELLKQRADLMGIKYSPNIGIETLRTRIQEKQNPDTDNPASSEAETIQEYQDAVQAGRVPAKATPTPHQLREQRKAKALRLIRVRVTCMDPTKGALKGQIFSSGNGELGMIKKFVPFNAEQGWHIPQILLHMIQEKKFMSHYETTVNGKKVKRHRLVPTYAVEILPALSEKELNDLKQRQLMAQQG